MSRREKFRKGLGTFTGDIKRVFSGTGASRPNTPSIERPRANTPLADGQATTLEAGFLDASSAASTPASTLVNPQPSEVSDINTHTDQPVPHTYSPERDRSGETESETKVQSLSMRPAGAGVDAPGQLNLQKVKTTIVDEPLISNRNKEASSSADLTPQASHRTSTMRTGLMELGRVLGPVTGLFGPVKELVAVIEGCVDTYEASSMAATARVEYDGMRVRLEATIEDLRRYCEDGHSLTMTTSMESICGSIRAELEKIRNKLEKNRAVRYLEAPDEVDSIERSYQRIELDLQRLGLNANWEIMKDVKDQAASGRIDRLSPSLSARYNSAESDDELKRQACTPGTRINVLDNILGWAHSGDDGSIYWLNGMAGTGKTTIAYSLCDKLQAEHKLAASFFCSRLREDCRMVKRIIPSIAYQLARFSLPFLSVLSAALQKNLDVSSSSLSIQFDEMIVKPLRATEDTLPKGLVIVIDALDECENKDSTGRILDILLNKAADLPVRFMVSSRPEAEIRDRMTDDLVRSRLVLHELEKGEVQADIETFLRAGLAPIKPSEEDIAQLVARAGILFIYAATAVRYIAYDNFQSDPKGRLADILEGLQSGEGGGSEEIDNLYMTILEAALDNRRLRKGQADNMRQVLYTVICAREPLSTGGLSELLGVKDVERVRTALRPLWSVLHIVGENELVTTLHASFPDFMFDSARSKNYYCDSNAHHRKLAEHCLDYIARTKPQFNICGLESSYLPDEKVTELEKRVTYLIPLELLYACRYWADHVDAGNCASSLVEQIRDFLSTRLLLWMEILNLKNQMKAGIECAKLIVKWYKEDEAEQDLAELALDAKRFVEAFTSNPVSQSTPHIYVSMLAFWPRSAPVVKHYEKYTRGPLEAKGTALDQRQLAHLSTWVFEKPISQIAVSPDGEQLALAIGNEVLVVDSTSGRVIAGPFQCHKKDLKVITFTPDGCRILAGLLKYPNKDATILGWDTRSGDTVLGPLQLCGHTSGIKYLSFSSNCFWIATGASDKTVRVWGAQTGETLLRLEAQYSVDVVAFSPDGTRVAAALGNALQVWDSQSGETIFGPVTVAGFHWINLISLSSNNLRLIYSSSHDRAIEVKDVQGDNAVVRPIAEHPAYISCMAYSPDDKHIVSGSDDRAVRIWDIETGDMVLGPLGAHKSRVNSVAFSPDGSRIISACRDGLVCTWDAQQRSLTPNSGSTHIPSDGITCVKFSSDGTHFVSCSEETICIWDADTGEMAIGPVRVHTGKINAVDFKNDRIVSGSEDGKICICDARTGEIVLGPSEVSLWAIKAIAYSPDGKFIATGSSARVDVWDAQNGSRVLGPLTDLPGNISSVQFSPDGTRIVASSWGNGPNVVVWDVADGRNVFGTLDGHLNSVDSVSHSPNGALIASGSDDRTIILWDAYTGKKAIGPLTGHSSWVNTVSFSPDSTRLVSGSSNKPIRIWDVQTGEILFELPHGHKESIRSVEYSPDGTRILSRSYGTSVGIHDARSPEERAHFEFRGSTMRKDGWVVDEQSRLLFWVPGDLRNGVIWPSQYLALIPQGSIRLKFDQSRAGESWARSFTSDT